MAGRKDRCDGSIAAIVLCAYRFVGDKRSGVFDVAMQPQGGDLVGNFFEELSLGLDVRGFFVFIL